MDDSGIELENPNPDHVALGKRGCPADGLFCNAFVAIKRFWSYSPTKNTLKLVLKW